MEATWTSETLVSYRNTYTASQPKRPRLEISPPWQPQNSLRIPAYESMLLTYSLTHFMVQDIIWKSDNHSACQKISSFLYETRRFITVFTKARRWTLPWASRIQFVPSIPISLRSSLLLSSHLRLGLPNGLLPSDFQPKPCKHLPLPHSSHPPWFNYRNNIRWSPCGDRGIRIVPP
jgi:hypothetical protein